MANTTPEQRLYLAAISVARAEIALENAKIELSEATRMFAEQAQTGWECGNCGKWLTNSEIVGVQPHCNGCGKSHYVRRPLGPAKEESPKCQECLHPSHEPGKCSGSNNSPSLAAPIPCGCDTRLKA